ncbi:hypothetical protein B2J88_08045 [Rhodococcus sp. SRB_17]|nr:hypothetical protein [Rhodococcus sp. SRB_17]
MVTAAEQLAAIWFRFPITVERHAGEGPFGPTFEEPDSGTPEKPLLGKVTAKRKLVRAADGTEVISEARVSLPAGTALIPVDSLVRLPPEFGGRTAQVLADQLHHDGSGLTPNFYSVDLT